VQLALNDLSSGLALDPIQFIGIPIAVVGACFLSFGAQFQSRGVSKMETKSGTDGSTGGLNLRQLRLLVARPSWVIGTLMIFLAIAFQLVSLGFAPIIVVQPLGAVALVVTAILNTRWSGIRLNKRSLLAIALCVGGVIMFSVIAAFTAREPDVTERDLIEILIILGVVLVLFVIAFITLRKRFKAIAYVVSAGVLYGFVATLAKVVIARITQGEFDWLTLICAVALLAVVILGAYFVQNAYASGPPDLVIAGLTVIDPLVAVTIGIVVLDEASQAPVWAAFAFVVTGVVAVIGVFLLSRYHPQSQEQSGQQEPSGSAE
jgi:drug/metabolite transporter (DMT)-like permease